ncbi:hypothetical protein AYO22_01908 [Fonsecaea multimorphosa]|nr:hypothetical protein AYO22_01908 [Fonsecaea multimorphosa]
MAGLVENPVLIPFPQNEKIAVHTPRDPPVVRWNGGRSSNPSAIGWLRETLKDSPIVEMRRRYEEDGYILIKGLIPREVVLDMREHYFTHMRSTGLIAPGSDPRDGLFDFSSSPEEFNSIGAPSYPDRTKLQAMAAAHCTPEYLDFLQNPQMREFVRQFMGWGKEVLLARTLLRHCVPHGISLAIHYDKIFLRGGNPANDFLTAWVPIGDITHDGGGLIYLKHSTEIGRQIEANFTEKAQTLPREERLRAYNKNMAPNGSLGPTPKSSTRPKVAISGQQRNGSRRTMRLEMSSFTTPTSSTAQR